MPSTYTADGENISPPLVWVDPPVGTKSFALIVEDPDAPNPAAPERTFVHWVVYDLPASAQSLHSAMADGELPPGAHQGLNDWHRVAYGGPAPPVGRHRYFHRLYALDTVLPELDAPTKANLVAAMQGHVLGKAQLVGTYERRH